MSGLKSVTGAKTSRSETVGVRLDPKLRYLAEIAAREQQRTTSSFIEWCIRRVLAQGAMAANMDDEPSPGHWPTPPPPLWMESLWDVDESDRFFNLATTRADLLTIPEQRLWKLYFLGRAGKKITIESFRLFWNNPSINTTHLQESGDK